MTGANAYDGSVVGFGVGSPGAETLKRGWG
jgi:hypothetical protein